MFFKRLFLNKKYNHYINSLSINKCKNVLIFCINEETILKKIFSKVKNATIVYLDNSSKRFYLLYKKKSDCNYKCYNFYDFMKYTNKCEFDLILFFNSLYQFNSSDRRIIMENIIERLKEKGEMFICEQINGSPNIKLHQVVNLIESFKVIGYQYHISKNHNRKYCEFKVWIKE